MTTMQKIIKYLAIAFALILIAAIVCSMMNAVTGIDAWLKSMDPNRSADAASSDSFSSEIRKLDMEIGAADVEILIGDELRVESDNPYITAAEVNGTLRIQESSHIADLADSSLTIWLPEDLMFEKAEITTGAGRIQSEHLVCRELEMELGAGEVEFHTLTAADHADIEGGAGQIVVHNGQLHNLSFEMGVGEGDITASITGDSEITAGVGALYLTIPGSPEEYSIHAEQGIGRIEIDNTHITGESTVGTGPNRLELEGGIGNITVDFEN